MRPEEVLAECKAVQEVVDFFDEVDEGSEEEWILVKIRPGIKCEDAERMLIDALAEKGYVTACMGEWDGHYSEDSE